MTWRAYICRWRGHTGREWRKTGGPHNEHGYFCTRCREPYELYRVNLDRRPRPVMGHRGPSLPPPLWERVT